MKQTYWTYLILFLVFFALFLAFARGDGNDLYDPKREEILLRDHRVPFGREHPFPSHVFHVSRGDAAMVLLS